MRTIVYTNLRMHLLPYYVLQFQTWFSLSWAVLISSLQAFQHHHILKQWSQLRHGIFLPPRFLGRNPLSGLSTYEFHVSETPFLKFPPADYFLLDLQCRPQKFLRAVPVFPNLFSICQPPGMFSLFLPIFPPNPTVKMDIVATLNYYFLLFNMSDFILFPSFSTLASFQTTSLHSSFPGVKINYFSLQSLCIVVNEQSYTFKVNKNLPEISISKTPPIYSPFFRVGGWYTNT